MAENADDLQKEKNLVWDIGQIRSDESVHVHYQGPVLAPCRRYFWRVRTTDNYEDASDWSKDAYWETGFMGEDRWKAQWISVDSDEAETDNPAGSSSRIPVS